MRKDKRRDNTIGDARDESRQNEKTDDEIKKMSRDETRRDRNEKVKETGLDEPRDET